MTKLTINIDEKFQNLRRAPIVEAVIDIRAHPTTALEEAILKSQLEGALSGYRFLDSMQDIQFQHEVNLQGGPQVNPTIRELNWKGLRFKSDDNRHIAQFNRDGFVFSCLESYESWEKLYNEGMRLWRAYVQFAQPVEIHRIGLRYINRFQLPPEDLQFEDYLQSAPEPPKGLDLPFYGFLHQDTLAVPDRPYAIKVIKTIQQPAPGTHGLTLILDIDAFTMQDFVTKEELLMSHLLEMRWLKNKVFFGSVTNNALKLFN